MMRLRNLSKIKKPKSVPKRYSTKSMFDTTDAPPFTTEEPETKSSRTFQGLIHPEIIRGSSTSKLTKSLKDMNDPYYSSKSRGQHVVDLIGAAKSDTQEYDEQNGTDVSTKREDLRKLYELNDGGPNDRVTAEDSQRVAGFELAGIKDYVMRWGKGQPKDLARMGFLLREMNLNDARDLDPVQDLSEGLDILQERVGPKDFDKMWEKAVIARDGDEYQAMEKLLDSASKPNKDVLGSKPPPRSIID